MNKENQKQNPKMTRSLEEDVIYYRGVVREAEAILTLKVHPGWEQLLQNILRQLEIVEMDLDKFEALSERDLVLRLKERKDFRWVIALVEKVEDKLPEVHQTLADCEKALAERKAKSGITS